MPIDAIGSRKAPWWSQAK